MTTAALNAQFLSLTGYKADIEFKIQNIMTKRQVMAYQTMNLAQAKSVAMQSNNDAQMKIIETQESILEQMDKILELDQKNIETQQKAASTEIESVSKLLDKNIQSSFKTFG